MGDTVVCEDAKLALWRRRARMAEADGFQGEGMVVGGRGSLLLGRFSYGRRGVSDIDVIKGQQSQDEEH